jgi:hypothetical protein
LIDICRAASLVSVASMIVASSGVHLTRLAPDGSDRHRGEKAKIMITQ